MTDDATPDHLDAFAAGYAEARAKFMLAAVQAGATLHSYVHPAAFGPDGGSLACDVAVLGGPAASKALVARPLNVNDPRPFESVLVFN